MKQISTNLKRPLIGAALLLALASCGSVSNKKGDNSTAAADSTAPGYAVDKPTTYTATPKYAPEMFQKIENLSTEFDNGIDTANWRTMPPNLFATWSFKSENATVEDGILNLTLKEERHKVGEKQLYFTSGILISKEKMTYGYYEAKIKGADLWPGCCPAFWLYSTNDIKDIEPQEANAISYNEIDIIELQQIAKDKNMLACNMHIMALKDKGNGELGNSFLSAGMYPKMGRNEFFAPEFNAEDDFHLYGAEVRPDSVVFYIDNRRVGSKPNLFWHLKGDQSMRVTLSLGVRTPYEMYDENRRRLAIDPETVEGYKPELFPTTMQVDYVRCYTRKDGYDTFPNNRVEKFDPEMFK